MKEISKPTIKKVWIAYNADGSVMHEGETEPNQVTTTGQPELAGFDSEEQLITFIASMDVENFPELPLVGEWVDAGVYKYGTDKVRCITSHTRMHYTIEEQPALFFVIKTVVGYPVWVQPTGAHDAYNIGDIVHYPNADSPLWKSQINGNTTVPDGDIPYNRYWEPFTL